MSKHSGAHARTAPGPKAQQRGFPSHYKTLSPIDRLRWLRGEECREKVKSGRLQQSQVSAEERKLRKKSAEVSKIVPTPARLDEFERGFPFPPMADHANCKMRRADVVLHDSEASVYFPASYLSEEEGDQGGREAGERRKNLVTFEVVAYRTHELQRALDLLEPSFQSPVSRIRPVRACDAGDLGLIEMKIDLPPEDEESLRAEIEERFNLDGVTGTRMTRMVF